MSQATPTLVYLDDEEINLILFKEMFKKDFQIFTTTSPQEALEYVSKNEVNFVLSDQLMPQMTGVEFLEKLGEAELPSNPKRIIISGYTREGEVNKAMEKNLINRFISKPWSYDKLKETLLSM